MELPEEERAHKRELGEPVSVDNEVAYATASPAVVLAEEIGERPSGGTGVFRIPRTAGSGGGLFSPRGTRPNRVDNDETNGKDGDR